MALPNFSKIFPNEATSPIYKNLCSVEFDDEILMDSCYRINKKYFYFNINDDNYIISKINDMINNNLEINLMINQSNKYGEILYKVFLKNFKFTKIDKLINFDWNSSNLRTLKVKYTYTEMRLILTKSDLRKIKMDEINNIE